MMYGGKKSTAQAIFYGALDELKTKITEEDSLTVFRKALENAKPQIEVRSRRVGGATYQVPVDVRPSRRVALAMKWLIEYSRERGEKDMGKRLAGELMDAYNNRGNAIKKKEDVHRMAEANKAFSHYNW
jgi:small subunit ribosomal protein S7